jgi:hypothetical protein
LYKEILSACSQSFKTVKRLDFGRRKSDPNDSAKRRLNRTARQLAFFHREALRHEYPATGTALRVTDMREDLVVPVIQARSVAQASVTRNRTDEFSEEMGDDERTNI